LPYGFSGALPKMDKKTDLLTEASYLRDRIKMRIKKHEK